MTRARHIPSLLFALLTALLLAAPWAQAQDTWSSVTPGARWVVGEQRVEAPGGSARPWQQHRYAQGLSTQTVAFDGRGLREAHAMIAAAYEAGHIAWERALIAANHRPDLIPTPLAEDWIVFLDTWPTLSEDERVAQHLSLRLRGVGAGLALAAPACLAHELESAALIAELARYEAATPGRRLRSRIEPTPPIDRDALTRALASADRAPVAAALLLLEIVAPADGWLDRFELHATIEDEHCALDLARTYLHTMTRGSEAWPELSASWARLTVTEPIPDRWLWRFAVHRYLHGDATAVTELREHFARGYPRDTDGLRYLHVLADIADGVVSQDERLWPPARSGSNPTYRWVSAEAARVRGETETAEKALQAVTDMDVHFVAAWLSLAAARSALQRQADVDRALTAAQEVAPPLPIYRYWVEQLASRRLP